MNEYFNLFILNNYNKTLLEALRYGINDTDSVEEIKLKILKNRTIIEIWFQNGICSKEVDEALGVDYLKYQVTGREFLNYFLSDNFQNDPLSKVTVQTVSGLKRLIRDSSLEGNVKLLSEVKGISQENKETTLVKNY